jgi:L-fucose mutarotase/ribose pyranase (RbsD/FucU family)
MALSEATMNDKIEVLHLAGYPVIQVRTATIISRDDVEISRSFSRHVLTPDADLSSEDADVVAIARCSLYKEAKEAYATHLEAQGE